MASAEETSTKHTADALEGHALGPQFTPNCGEVLQFCISSTAISCAFSGDHHEIATGTGGPCFRLRDGTGRGKIASLS
jgi:hypothetical protein